MRLWGVEGTTNSGYGATISSNARRSNAMPTPAVGWFAAMAHNFRDSRARRLCASRQLVNMPRQL